MFVPGFAGTVRELHFGADTTHDHIHHEPQEGPHAVDVRRGNHQIQVYRLFMVHQIVDTEVTRSGVQGHHGIAVQRQIGQGRGDNAGCFILRLVAHLPCG